MGYGELQFPWLEVLVKDESCCKYYILAYEN